MVRATAERGVLSSRPLRAGPSLAARCGAGYPAVAVAQSCSSRTRRWGVDGGGRGRRRLRCRSGAHFLPRVRFSLHSTSKPTPSFVPAWRRMRQPPSSYPVLPTESSTDLSISRTPSNFCGGSLETKPSGTIAVPGDRNVDPDLPRVLRWVITHGAPHLRGVLERTTGPAVHLHLARSRHWSGRPRRQPARRRRRAPRSRSRRDVNVRVPARRLPASDGKRE
jgi:hypothetical protein